MTEVSPRLALTAKRGEQYDCGEPRFIIVDH
jgi:hypothetical protein